MKSIPPRARIVIGLLSACPVMAQPSIQWQTSLGGSDNEEAYGMAAMADGGCIAVGKTSSYNGDVTGYHGGGTDGWVVKLDANGGLEWQRCLGGSDNDWLWAVEQTTDGGYITVGDTRSNDGDVSGLMGLLDVWVVKLDSSGAIQWQQCLGGTLNESGRTIQQTSDGGYVLLAHSRSIDGHVTQNQGEADLWLVKLTSTGVVEWQRSYGGSASERAGSVRETANGGYFLAGQTLSNNGDVTGYHGSGDLWVLKVDAIGDIVWQIALGGTSFELSGFAMPTADGGCLMSGSPDSNDGNVSGNHGDTDAWLVKLNADAIIQWQQCRGGSVAEYAQEVALAPGGGYFVSGHTGSNDGDVTGHHGGLDMWVMHLDTAGNILWQKAIGGSITDMSWAMRPAVDGGLYVAGVSDSNDGDISGNNGMADFCVVKLYPIPLAMEAPDAPLLTPYPVPFLDELNVPLEGASFVTVRDALGRLMPVPAPVAQPYRIDTRAWPPGLYIVAVAGKRVACVKQ